MCICQLCRDPPSRCSLNRNPFFNKIRLVHILYCSGIFTYRSCQRIQSNWTPGKSFYDRQQKIPVCLIQSILIYVKKIQCIISPHLL